MLDNAPMDTAMNQFLAALASGLENRGDFSGGLAEADPISRSAADTVAYLHFGESPSDRFVAQPISNHDALFSAPSGFADRAAIYDPAYSNTAFMAGSGNMASVRDRASRDALLFWSEVARISTPKVTHRASITGTSADSYLPATLTTGGTGEGRDGVVPNVMSEGARSVLAVLCEIGRALDHVDLRPAPLNAMTLDGTKRFATDDDFPATPMLNDRSAIQLIYGTGAEAGAGSTVLGWRAGRQMMKTVSDAADNGAAQRARRRVAAIRAPDDGRPGSGLGAGRTHANMPPPRHPDPSGPAPSGEAYDAAASAGPRRGVRQPATAHSKHWATSRPRRGQKSGRAEFARIAAIGDVTRPDFETLPGALRPPTVRKAAIAARGGRAR